MTGDTGSFLAIGAVLFVLGAIGFITRRNLILIVLSAELMLHGVSLTMLSFGKMHGTNEGQAFTVFMLTVATSEAGLLLSLILALYQRSRSLDVEIWSELREMDLPQIGGADDADEGPIEAKPEPVLPRLVPAGQLPEVDDDVPLEQLAEARRRILSSPLGAGHQK